MPNEDQNTRALYWLIALNAMPVLGVLFFNWHIFELVVLYWAENVIIGVFTVLKLVVRPYQSRLALIVPLFLAPFFLVHYGGFTAGHGLFVFAMFGKDWAASTGLPDHRLPWELVVNRGLMFALLGLLLMHFLEWRRDVAKRGLGADGVLALMFAPYRRIVVLHITIIGSGFLFMELGEPIAALLLMVALKTGFDVYHLRKGSDIFDGSVISDRKAKYLKDGVIAKSFTINGQEYKFDTCTEMAQSTHYQTAMKLMRVMLSREELAFAEDFLAEKIAEEMALVDAGSSA